MDNISFSNAKKVKNDEFYTRFNDIVIEVMSYGEQFKNKTVYCNCDDISRSNFYKFFYNYFNFFKLKKLIVTNYNPNLNKVYKIEIDKYGEQPKKTLLEGNGDFRSKECIELLKESDVVITNPPFSLFREYIKQLIDYNKKFLVIGPNGAITYKNIFNYFKENKIWIGYKYGSMEFETKDNRIKKLGNINWYTNLELTTKKPIIRKTELIKNYNKDDYPNYDNYDAININKVKDIPKDYYGIMGVPITYVDKHNPKLFKLLGQSNTDKKNTYFVKGKKIYTRIFIQRKDRQ